MAPRMGRPAAPLFDPPLPPPQFNLVAALPGLAPAPSMQWGPTPGGGYGRNKNPTNSSPATANRAMHSCIGAAASAFPTRPAPLRLACPSTPSSCSFLLKGRGAGVKAIRQVGWALPSGARPPNVKIYLMHLHLAGQRGIYSAGAAPGGALRGRPSPGADHLLHLTLLIASWPHPAHHPLHAPLTARNTAHHQNVKCL